MPDDFIMAGENCKKNGGSLVEINDQQENDFITQNLLLQNPTETHYWTGGLTTMLAGIQIGIWHASQNQITFNKFYESMPNVTETGVTLELNNENYYTWTTKNLKTSLPYVCETPFKNIGCLTDPIGAQYNGTASISEFGHSCLPWNNSDLQMFFKDQPSWGHNYCRNPGDEESPICFTGNINLFQYIQNIKFLKSIIRQSI